MQEETFSSSVKIIVDLRKSSCRQANAVQLVEIDCKNSSIFFISTVVARKRALVRVRGCNSQLSVWTLLPRYAFHSSNPPCFSRGRITFHQSSLGTKWHTTSISTRKQQKNNNTVNKLILDGRSCRKLHKKVRFGSPVFITSGIFILFYFLLLY